MIHLIEKGKKSTKTVSDSKVSYESIGWASGYAKLFCRAALLLGETKSSWERGGKNLEAQVLNGSAVEGFRATEGTAQVHSRAPRVQDGQRGARGAARGEGGEVFCRSFPSQEKCRVPRKGEYIGCGLRYCFLVALLNQIAELG